MSNVVIKVENLSKQYRLGVIGTGTLTRDLQSWWAKTCGKEDPNVKMVHKSTGSQGNGYKDKTSQHSRSKNNDFIWALKNVGFEVKHGEVLGIIGRNGAGKSTLLKILSRVTAPTSGVVKIKGRIASLLEVGTGFHPELTGRENIYLNGSILGMTHKEIDRKFDEIVDFTEIEQYIDTPVKRYSSGMYVRLAFAVAAHLEPEILMVDEVLAVGDVSFQKKCLGKMGDVANEGRTVLFVSHNMGAVSRLCHRGILLHQGRILMDGDALTVIRRYNSLGVAQRAEYAQNANPHKPIHLRRVYLATVKNEVKEEFRYTDRIQIHIDYDVNQSVKGCSVWFDIRTMEDIIAFGTTDTDSNPERMGVRRTGAYHASVNLPRRWLNVGKYYLVVGISVPRLKRSFDRVEALEFCILDDGTPEQLQTGFNRRGILQPFLDWKTKYQPL
jgi:lipopolysaccharide transport system ATP-binding protein